MASLRSSTPGRRGVGMEAGGARAQQPQGYRAPAVQQQQQQQQVASPRVGAAAQVAILWDIENCPVPVEVNAEDVAGNIRVALREHPHIGAVTMFSAYGDFNHFPKKVREGCQRTGVNLIDVPNGKKDAADKAILVDMFLFALDNPPPSTIFLVTGDVDFAPALHKLGQRGYVVVLVIPDGVGVSPALRGAGRYVWDWPSLCRGHGLVEVPNVRRRAIPEQQPLPHTINTTAPTADDDDHVQGEEILVQRKFFVDPQPRFGHPRGNVTTTSPSIRHYPGRANPFPTSDVNDLGFANSDATEPTSPGGGGGGGGNWVQPGDLAGLKKQLVWLVTQQGGKMTLVKVPAEYQKQYGRPLYLAEYNVLKLVHLVEKMKDALVLKGDGTQRTLHLVENKERVKGHNKYKPSSRRPSLPKDSEDSDPEVKETIKAELAVPESGVSKRHLMDMDMDEVKPAVLAALPSDWESVADVVKVKLDPIKTETVVSVGEVCKVEDYEEDLKLARFKEELQALLVVYACNIPLKLFVELYKQRYARALDLHSFGVTTLEALFQKVKDVAKLDEKGGKGDTHVVYVPAV